MDVAEAHLIKKGYLGVSLEEIAREVGVTKPALYYHFSGGKEQLFVEITHRSLRRAREGLEREMSAEESGAGKLRAAARWLMADRDRGRAMGELKDIADRVGEEYRAGLNEGFFADLYNPIHRAIASAVESGEFRDDDPEFLTWAFLSLASGMMEVEDMPAQITPGTDQSGGERTAEEMVGLFLNGVLK